MAPVTQEQRENRRLVAPSSLQIAFAFVIVRSKPDQVVLRDYISQLRKHLRSGSQIKSNSKHRHLDAVSFWRTQFEQAETLQSELRAKLIDLERKNDRLEAQLKLAQQAGSARTPVSVKRKNAAVDAMMTKSSKKAKLAADSILSESSNVRDTFAEDFETLDGTGEAATTLVQGLYSIHKLYKQPDPNLDSMCFTLIQSTSALASTISAFCKQQHTAFSSGAAHEQRRPQATLSNTSKQEAEFAAVLRVAARAFTSILLGLAKLSQHSGSEQRCGLIIHECAKMSRSLLDTITESALTTAKLAIATTFAEEPHAGKKKSRPRTARVAKEHNIPRAVSYFITATLSYLDASEPLHRELFEAFMFVILDRIGKRLYVCTFDRERSATIEGDICPPMHLGSATAGPRKELEMKALSLEVPSLISILRKAMALAPEHFSPAPTPKHKSSKATGSKFAAVPATTATGGKNVLSIQAKEKLQQTLVNCTFGAEGDDGLGDCLRMPPRLGQMPPQPKIEERDIPSWFRQEVWRLLGWEILGKEGDW